MKTLDELVADLTEQGDYIMDIHRHTASSVDGEEARSAVAMVLRPSADSEHALVISGSISGDNSEATATIWAFRDGVQVDVDPVMLDALFISTRLDN